MSWGYFEIDSQRPTSMPFSDTLMISPFAAMPGMLFVTRKEAFFMANLRSQGCSPKLGRQETCRIGRVGSFLRTIIRYHSETESYRSITGGLQEYLAICNER